MGPAVPYAIAAKFCYPDRVAIALAGDGAMQMNGLDELITVAKYWRSGRSAADRAGAQQPRSEHGDVGAAVAGRRSEIRASQELPDFPYADYARSLGLDGVRIDHPDEIGPAWDSALSAGRPFVLEAVTDPNVPPMPPHISLEQAQAFASSVLKGDSERWAS
jgi:pyruvate dehydrogenase (quinone)